MTEQELASHLKICRRQPYNWRVAGLLPYFKMGKAVRFRVADDRQALARVTTDLLLNWQPYGTIPKSET